MSTDTPPGEYKKLEEEKKGKKTASPSTYGSITLGRKSSLDSSLDINKEEKKSAGDGPAPKRIMLIFQRPPEQKDELSFGHRGYIRSHLKDKDTCVIYVDKNDFKDGKLKEDSIDKYKHIKETDSSTLIEIHGHGSQYYPEKIGSDRSAYTPFEQTTFSISEVASIFDLLNNPTVRKTRDSLGEMKQLPAEHLRISLLSCEGQEFAANLFKELTKGKNPLLCSISAVKNDLYQYFQLGNFWRDKPLANYCNKTLTKAIMGVTATSGLAVWAIIPLGVGGGLLIAESQGINLDGLKVRPEELVKDSAIILGVALGIALAMYAIHLASLKSDNAAKVVVVPDFEQLDPKSSLSEPIPAKIIDNAAFIDQDPKSTKEISHPNLQ